MIAIRQRTTFLLCVALGLLLLAGGVILYGTLRYVLVAQFDATLLAKAQALIVAAELDDGKVEIDFDVQEFAGFGARARGDYFEIVRADGRVLAKSPSLAEARLALPRDEAQLSYGSLRLPDGRPGRAIRESFSIEGDRRGGESLEVMVASYSGGLEQSLRSIALVLLITGVAGLVLVAVLVRFALKVGLRPLDALAAQVRTIRADRLHERLRSTELPPELQPIAEKLNEMLERLEAGFARERRFSSHAAHELRTPLAELKVMAELVTRWPEEFTRERGEEMLKVLAENEALLDKLALLSRAETGGEILRHESVNLREAVAVAMEKIRIEGEKRSLILRTEVAPESLTTDPVLWNAILHNLLSNAVSHAPSRSEVFVRVSTQRLEVSNPAPALVEEDVAHLFERFWRKSAARSERHHSGLGLSIVAACAEVLGGSCAARLKDGVLTIEVCWPRASV